MGHCARQRMVMLLRLSARVLCLKLCRVLPATRVALSMPLSLECLAHGMTPLPACASDGSDGRSQEMLPAFTLEPKRSVVDSGRGGSPLLCTRANHEVPSDSLDKRHATEIKGQTFADFQKGGNRWSLREPTL